MMLRCLGRLGSRGVPKIVRWTSSSSTDNPALNPFPENPFNKAEEEALQKVISSRAKDLPSSEMKNPFEKEKVKCILCQLDINPSYKNLRLLSQFVSSFTGKPYGRHITGLCKGKQELVEKEIMKARNLGMMPYMLKNAKFLKDPPLYDPEKPLRPHNY
ncbi:small ribosomal subunit protein bS18m [Neocloeon triangulifer]|uniref:small ribosomal subunit protein bS18m n=1 Tax=Neocloeon triangulifer TaxID=2078957 RepID=UPI00286EECF5|nr:small ribosomal subunit protein bS18m [Neocloeon triangulifer]